MEVYRFILCCVVFTAATSLSIPDYFQKYDSDSLLEVAESNRCECSNGKCVTDNRGNVKCVCKPGYALQDEFTCKPCDCGSKGKCIFTLKPKARGGFTYEKKCVCDVGSAEKNGKCIDCYCGENSACEFHGEEKNCYCIEGFSEKDGVCTKCDCGFYGKCEFVQGNKKCECDEGYLEFHGVCEECDCGENSIKCRFLGDGYKQCDCKWKYSERFGKCEECDCGEHGTCSFMEGSKYCQCENGFRENLGKCDKCDCGENSEDCHFSNGVKQCKCKEKFSDKDGICEECDCGPYSFACSFENYRKKCMCSEGYVQKGSSCEVGCSHYNPCKNGGYCKEGFCDCLPGTSGEFCEVIDECYSLCPDKNDIQCIYDISRKQPICECLDNNLRYDPGRKQCHNSCDDHRRCLNGGICSSSGDGYAEFCRCLEGTAGDFCENISECNNKRCGPDAQCAYDIAEKSAVCRCSDSNLSFDEKTMKCKNPCDNHRRCLNGGICSSSGDGYAKFCRCLEGTAGDFCENISECNNKRCGPDAQCAYDIAEKRAVCRCSDSNLSFDEKTMKCKNSCDNHRRCLNGGICSSSGDGHAKFCRCLEGTAGDFCENISECNHKRCGPDAQCAYDIAEKRAVCRCSDSNLSFDEKTMKCKRTCEGDMGCNNGARCVDRFCDCLDGTSGDLCETVSECDVKDCGPDAKCKYDVDKLSAVCVCNDARHSFDEKDRACKRTCEDDSGCGNGARCVDRFCDCLDGTSGDLCETVPECDIKDCGQDAKCVYSVDRKSAACACNDARYSFHDADRTCKRGCTEDEECNNGGKCVSKGFDKFCDCLPGTEGDLCETVDDCKEGRTKCKSDARCVFDVQKLKAVCECSDTRKRYDVLSDECKLTCYEDATCHNGGLCMHRGDHLFCECKVGTSGNLCEIVDDCQRGLCGYTNEVQCLYDMAKETAVCKCKSSERIFDESTKTCQACDCGKHAISCRFENARKVCICPHGYDVRNGTCQKVKCTEKVCQNGKCQVVDGKEVCSCFEGYALEGDYCRKLNCSKTPCINGTCVVRHGNREECVCQAGYTLKDGACIRGACRMDTCFGGTCKMVEEELMCICPKNYSLQGIGCFATVCKKQYCFGGWCVVNDNKEEICTCLDGYILVNDVCKKILCNKPCFGGQCKLIDGKEECICPPGYSIFEGVCRDNRIPWRNM